MFSLAADTYMISLLGTVILFIVDCVIWKLVVDCNEVCHDFVCSFWG